MGNEKRSVLSPYVALLRQAAATSTESGASAGSGKRRCLYDKAFLSWMHIAGRSDITCVSTCATFSDKSKPTAAKP